MEDQTEFHKSLCNYCFANLENFLQNKKSIDYPESFDQHKYPLFVTYQFDGMLRGCIGTFAEAPLGKNLQEYSLIAAFKDSRFPPIKEQELPHLTLEISLLMHFE